MMAIDTALSESQPPVIGELMPLRRITRAQAMKAMAHSTETSKGLSRDIAGAEEVAATPYTKVEPQKCKQKSNGSKRDGNLVARTSRKLTDLDGKPSIELSKDHSTLPTKRSGAGRARVLKVTTESHKIRTTSQKTPAPTASGSTIASAHKLHKKSSAVVKSNLKTKSTIPVATSRRNESSQQVVNSKKVKFEDEGNKENAVTSMSPRRPIVPKRRALKDSGLYLKQSKPVRTSRTTRATRQAVLPLSPKKITQITPSKSISDDELADDKPSPHKTLQRLMTPSRGSLKKCMIGMHDQARSSAIKPQFMGDIKTSTSSLRSPMRPLHPVNSQDGISASPRKFQIATSPVKSISAGVIVRSPTKSSLLSESPRKCKLSTNLVIPPVGMGKSMLKTSLLQSPARRNAPSPFKVTQNTQVTRHPTAGGRTQSSVEKSLSTDTLIGMESTTYLNDSSDQNSIPLGCDDSQNYPQSSNFQALTPNVMWTKWRKASLDSCLSEDELSSPHRRFNSNFIKQTPSHITSNPGRVFPDIGMTPLVADMAKWAPQASQPKCLDSQPTIFRAESLPSVVDAVQPQGLLAGSGFEDELACLLTDRWGIVDHRALPHSTATAATVGSMTYPQPSSVHDSGDLPIVEHPDFESDLCAVAKNSAQFLNEPHQRSLIPPNSCTVSKVPLRSSSSKNVPFRSNRTRSKSLTHVSSSLVKVSESEGHGTIKIKAAPICHSNAMSKRRLSLPCSDDHASDDDEIEAPSESKILTGAIVLVDVYTTEGADAGGLFTELLTQMGARCVKSWNWNPRSSVTDNNDITMTPGNTKPGITHVVYKDGGVRTLEKIRLSNGLVQCVGVSWVLDCERQARWLNESAYSIDTSTIPRGGQRRRKSMEPRALSNVSGTLVAAPLNNFDIFSFTAPSTPRRATCSTRLQSTLETQPTPKTPSSAAQSDIAHSMASDEISPRTITPSRAPIHWVDRSSDSHEDNETTLHLVQRTCPSKHQRQQDNRAWDAVGHDEPQHHSFLSKRRSLQLPVWPGI